MISVNKKIVEKLIKDNRFNKSKVTDLLNIDRKALYGWFDNLADNQIIKNLKVVDINKVAARIFEFCLETFTKLKLITDSISATTFNIIGLLQRETNNDKK